MSLKNPNNFEKRLYKSGLLIQLLIPYRFLTKIQKLREKTFGSKTQSAKPWLNHKDYQLCLHKLY